MARDIAVKICGITRPEDMAAAATAGARYVGLNFFPKSPRYVTPQAAAQLSEHAPMGMAKVGLVVDADNAFLDDILGTAPLDMVQLHGKESPARVQEVKARYGLPVIKAVGVAEASDLPKIDVYAAVADILLIDAKPPKDAVLPGGNGLTFDWSLLAARKYWQKPWMLAGGLTPDNAAEAVRRTGARQLDVASGVESAPGVKDAALMQAFVQAAQID